MSALQSTIRRASRKLQPGFAWVLELARAGDHVPRRTDSVVPKPVSKAWQSPCSY